MRLKKQREEQLRRNIPENRFVKELFQEIDALRADLKCNNSRCDIKTIHHNVWCDHIVQKDIQYLIKERDEFYAGMSQALQMQSLLQKERDRWKQEYLDLCEIANGWEEKAEKLKAENAHLKETIKEFGETTQHQSKRIEKLRKYLLKMSGHCVHDLDFPCDCSTRLGMIAREALAQDDEEAKG